MIKKVVNKKIVPINNSVTKRSSENTTALFLTV